MCGRAGCPIISQQKIYYRNVNIMKIYKFTNIKMLLIKNSDKSIYLKVQ